jgi:bifunctional DNase/RNase
LIPVKVKEVVLDPMQTPLLLLVDTEETMVLPIGIGFWEAQAIVLKLQGYVTPRPVTHDLFNSVCKHLGASIEKVVVNDMIESTFYAELYLRTAENKQIIVDARPSDAVALALTVGCPIYISEKLSPYTVSISDLMEQQDIGPIEFDGSGESGPHLH